MSSSVTSCSKAALRLRFMIPLLAAIGLPLLSDASNSCGFASFRSKSFVEQHVAFTAMTKFRHSHSGFAFRPRRFRRHRSWMNMADIDGKEEIFFDDFPKGPQYGGVGDGATNALETTYTDDADLFAMVGSAQDEEEEEEGDAGETQDFDDGNGENEEEEDWEQYYLEEDDDDDFDLSDFHPDDIRQVDEIIQSLRYNMLQDLEERHSENPAAVGSIDVAVRLIESVLEERRFDELEERREARFEMEMRQREDEIRKFVSGRGGGAAADGGDGRRLSPLDVVEEPSPSDEPLSSDEPPKDTKGAS